MRKVSEEAVKIQDGSRHMTGALHLAVTARKIYISKIERVDRKEDEEEFRSVMEFEDEGKSFVDKPFFVPQVFVKAIQNESNT